MLLKALKAYWFPLGLAAIGAATLLDGSGAVAAGGTWLKAHHGPDAVIALIFFLSGLILKREEIRAGLGDVKGTLAAMAVIVVPAPLTALILDRLPLTPGLRIGLFLTAVMPTTLSSGVVMTGAAGGNMAHALLITLLSNGLGVVTVPLSLAMLLRPGNVLQSVPFDRVGLMLRIATLVLLPLVFGLALRPGRTALLTWLRKTVPFANQIFVLAILWMAFSGARSSVVGGGMQIAAAVLLSFVFHALLVAAALLVSHLAGLGAGRRESVVFMGGQKTLALSILIQTMLFPQYGIALAFCVIHHFVHLVMDGYLVSWFRRRRGIP